MHKQKFDFETAPIHFSATASQKGFGSDFYKSVVGLTKEEREKAKAGEIIVFLSRLSGGNHGTPWRYVTFDNQYSKNRYYPRVPSPELLERIALEVSQ